MSYLGINLLVLIISLGLLVCLSFVSPIIRSKRIPKGLRLPPGPPGKFIYGNASDMPTHHEWETFTQWAKDYGDIVYAEVMGKPIVIVNSAHVALELFERRSRIYSDRFDFPMMNDLMGFDWDFGLMRYGDRWRRHRRMFHQEFRLTASAKYQRIQTQQTRSALRRLYQTPDDFVKHMRYLTGAIILEVTYGFKTLPGDRYIEAAEKAAAAMVAAGVPGAFLVDFIPALKYIPEWMGAGFQKKAREVRSLATEVAQAPYLAVKNNLRSGTANPSVLVSLLEGLDTHPGAPSDQEEVARNTAAVAYLAGADTTVSSLTTFILAMVLNPDVQRKAQAELDSVVGTDQLPEFSDRPNLPFIDALCKEVLRWHPVAPLGVAHQLMQDDAYGEYFIPGGSTVIGNIWAMLHDERNVGPQPELFKPERFLDSGIGRPTFMFGFGRRICPGRHLADNSIFIGIASILKVFDIIPAKDSNGNNISVEPAFTSGFVSYPESFRCSIVPRSVSARELLLAGVIE